MSAVAGHLVRRKPHVAIGAVLLSVLALTGCTTPEVGLPNLTNDDRKAAGLRPLSTTVFDAATTARIKDGAVRHSQNMCAQRRLFHSNIVERMQPPGGWKWLGENVGVIGWSSDQNTWLNTTVGMFNAFKGSPGHYANIMKPEATHQVVGQHVCDDGTIYVTHFFAQY